MESALCIELLDEPNLGCEVPALLDRLLVYFGIRVQIFPDLPAAVSGFFVPKPDAPVIGVAPGLSRQQRHCVVAHAIQDFLALTAVAETGSLLANALN